MDRTRELILLAIGAAYSTPENASKQVDAVLASEIADRLIDSGLVASPPPAAQLRRSAAAVTPTATSASPAKHRGRPKGSKDYICTDCKHAFRAVDPASCPHCNGGNFVLKKAYNPDIL